jgi:hypothetical protein
LSGQRVLLSGQRVLWNRDWSEGFPFSLCSDTPVKHGERVPQIPWKTAPGACVDAMRPCARDTGRSKVRIVVALDPNTLRNALGTLAEHVVGVRASKKHFE